MSATASGVIQSELALLPMYYNTRASLLVYAAMGRQAGTGGGGRRIKYLRKERLMGLNLRSWETKKMVWSAREGFDVSVT